MAQRNRPTESSSPSSTGIALTLTEQQAQHLAELLDVATKAGGLQVAKVAIPIMDLLMDSVSKGANNGNTTKRSND